MLGLRTLIPAEPKHLGMGSTQPESESLGVMIGKALGFKTHKIHYTLAIGLLHIENSGGQHLTCWMWSPSCLLHQSPVVYGEIWGFSSHTLVSLTFTINVSLGLRQFYWDLMLVNHTGFKPSFDAGWGTLDRKGKRIIQVDLNSGKDILLLF